MRRETPDWPFGSAVVPAEAMRLMVDQLASSRMIDPALAQKTPLTAYYENRYVEELEKEGFFKKLWQ